MTISKTFHLTFSRGWSGNLPRPLQGRVSEISAICRAKCQTDKLVKDLISRTEIKSFVQEAR